MITTSPQHNTRWNSGLGLVEIVVVAGIISIVFVGLLQLLVLTLRPVEESVRQTQATFFAEEGIEAVKAMRNGGWSTNIDPLASSTTYYPVIVSDDWALTTTDPGPVDGMYDRTVVLEDVYRDANDDIASTGTLDSKTKKVVSTVSWLDHEQSKTVTIETYITNFRSS